MAAIDESTITQPNKAGANENACRRSAPDLGKLWGNMTRAERAALCLAIAKVERRIDDLNKPSEHLGEPCGLSLGDLYDLKTLSQNCVALLRAAADDELDGGDMLSLVEAALQYAETADGMIDEVL